MSYNPYATYGQQPAQASPYGGYAGAYGAGAEPQAAQPAQPAQPAPGAPAAPGAQPGQGPYGGYGSYGSYGSYGAPQAPQPAQPSQPAQAPQAPQPPQAQPAPNPYGQPALQPGAQPVAPSAPQPGQAPQEPQVGQPPQSPQAQPPFPGQPPQNPMYPTNLNLSSPSYSSLSTPVTPSGMIAGQPGVPGVPGVPAGPGAQPGQGIYPQQPGMQPGMAGMPGAQPGMMGMPRMPGMQPGMPGMHGMPGMPAPNSPTSSFTRNPNQVFRIDCARTVTVDCDLRRDFQCATFCTSFVDCNGALIAYGGGETASNIIFTIRDGVVSSMPITHACTTGHASCSFNGYYVMHGGTNGSVINFMQAMANPTLLYIINPATNQVDTQYLRGDIPSPRVGHRMLQLDATRILLAGGIGADARPLDDTYIINMNDFTISRSAPLPMAAGNFVFVKVNGTMMMFGGGSSEGGSSEFFECGEQGWQSVGAVPLKPRKSAAFCAYEDKLFIFGGWDGSHLFSGLYMYDATQRKWTKVNFKGAKPGKRYGALLGINGGKIYICGGTNGFTDFKDVYVADVRGLLVKQY